MPNLADQDFQRVSAHHQLEILDELHTTLRTKHVLTLQAQRSARFYHRFYTWTGSGIEKDPIFVSGLDELGHATHRMHGPIIQNGSQRLFLVDLGREYQPGEQVELEFKQTLLDLDHKMQTFLGIAVNPGCRSFSLKVLIPGDIPVKASAVKFPTSNSAKTSWRAPVAAEPFESKYGRTNAFTFDETQPQHGFSYRIEWNLL